MENEPVRQMDTPALKWAGILLLIVCVFLAFAGSVEPAKAQGSCPPPRDESCRPDNGGGGNPGPLPPPTVAPPPGPGDPPPGPGPEPTNPPGPNPTVVPPNPRPTPPPGGCSDGYHHYPCLTNPACAEKANVTYFCGDYYGGCMCQFVYVTCVSHAACQSTPPQPPSSVRPPCKPVYDPATGITLKCTGDEYNGFHWNYDLFVWARVPPHKVESKTFPRWLVSVPGTLILNPQPEFSEEGGPSGGGEEGFWSDRVNIPANLDPAKPKVGQIRDYRIGVRWRRLKSYERQFGGSAVPPSCFNWDERDWNVTGGYAQAVSCGELVSHAYETSSFGKPRNGPHFIPENFGCAKVPGTWDLAAYQVTVPTYWVPEWADEWYAGEKSGTEWSECQCVGSGEPANVPTEGCTAPPGICNQPGQWYGKIGEDKVEWVRHFLGWDPVDLRDYGSPEWYYTSWKVVVNSGRTEWCAAGYSSDVRIAIPIPVIEVQSIIVDPCRLDGSCGDLNPPAPQ